MKTFAALTVIVLLFLAAPAPAPACTMVTVAKDGVILAGNNEDWRNPVTKMWFYPPAENEYGRVCFGFDRDFGFVQGGMNDQGLFIDANALAPAGWKADPGKAAFSGSIIEHILARCATVDDAIALFRKHNTPSLARAKFPIADAKGGAVVVEWGQGKLQCIKRTGWYQISTNFVQTNFSNPEDYPSHRYKISEQILKNSKTASIALVREVLSATHSEFFYPTLYSNIYDLKNKKIYLYNFHDFEHAVVLDLAEELKKGKKSYDIPSLFPIKTQAARLFERYASKPGSRELLKIIEKKGVKEAVKQYYVFKEDFIRVPRVKVDEVELNNLGYILLGTGKTREAIEIFKLNAVEHPGSANAYDSLGEAYKKNGDKELAVKNYKKSLELNPQNKNAERVLKQLLDTGKKKSR